jgi:DNA (cytosine-5)-methyltransferase 1
MNELALFAGAGGGILGGKLLGWRTACAVEYDAYAASVLVARQNDGCLEPFPVWADVRTFDGKPWRGIAEVVSGGFPCTDISAAGKGAGITGKQSGLWTEMARIVGEVRPRFVFVENSPLLVKRGLAVVLSDLAEMGYDARWGIVGAHHVGAPHKRDRCWILAYADSERRGIEREDYYEGAEVEASGHLELGNADGRCALVADANIAGREGRLHRRQDAQRQGELGHVGCGSAVDGQPRPHWWSTEPELGRLAHRVPSRTHRLRCTGNAQVPAVAALAWRLLGGPTA